MSRNRKSTAEDDYRRSAAEEESDYDEESRGDEPRTSELRERFEDLRELCAVRDCEIQKLKVQLSLAKSNGRTTKKKMRSDYLWSGEDAILADKVSEWVKNYLFPRYKFLKKGWMEFSNKPTAC